MVGPPSSVGTATWRKECDAACASYLRSLCDPSDPRSRDSAVKRPPRRTAARFILDNSLLLLAGTVAAVLWANVDLDTYDRFAHPLHFLVNDVGMVFFFALAAKEVFEATLPGGALASSRRALSPLAAAVGGMAAPALIYVGLTWARGPVDLARGWAI